MNLKLLSFFVVICMLSSMSKGCKCRNERKFPKDFLFGAASSAYQIEGAWDTDGKGVSMLDHYFHEYPEVTYDKSNGDVAADSYHLYKRDVEILKEMDAKTYRFSISWTRILPNGTTDYINEDGIAYYNALIDELLANDILPIVTLYHWDLPIGFSNEGGWLNENIADWYGEYARIVFKSFGDRIKNWITINEPFIHSSYGYGFGALPPMIKSPGVGFYEASRNLILAHARAYHIYNDEFREVQGGKVGLTLSMHWPYARTDSEDDAEGAKDYLALHLGQYMDPIFSETGNYPQRLIDRVAAASSKQGYNSSRLRPFTDEQIKYIKGTADFLGLNHYTSFYVYRNDSVLDMYEQPSYEDDIGVGFEMDPSWPATAVPEMRVYAPGFYDLLIYIKETYNNPVVYITENGFPESNDDLVDDGRLQYMRSYLNAVLDALADGANVQRYYFWTLLDTFEWISGYQINFGLYKMDRHDENHTRTARKSALVYKEIIRSREINENYNPDPYAK